MLATPLVGTLCSVCKGTVMAKRALKLDDPAETEAQRAARLARERQELDAARAQIDAGQGVDDARVRPWLDSLGTRRELPKPRATIRTTK